MYDGADGNPCSTALRNNNEIAFRNESADRVVDGFCKGKETRGDINRIADRGHSYTYRYTCRIGGYGEFLVFGNGGD